jgi:hypothetical protein
MKIGELREEDENMKGKMEEEEEKKKKKKKELVLPVIRDGICAIYYTMQYCAWEESL